MPDTSMRRSRRRIAGALCALFIGLESVVVGPAPIRAAVPEEVVAQAFVTPTSFGPDGDGNRDTIALAYQLVRDATVSIVVIDFLARPVRLLQAPALQPAGTYQVIWDGLTDGLTVAPNAGYRFRLTAAGDLGTFTIDRAFTKADSEIYPIAPGALTVAIDPGHGGSDPGAGSSGLVEKQVNLDIALRLRAMLAGVGVNVVMTREQDRRLNVARIDLTGDGSVGSADELTARIDVANQARADVFLVIHSNAASRSATAGIETWYTIERPWATENRLLATSVQSSIVGRLRAASAPLAGFRAVDRGTRRIMFYVNGPYHVKNRPRPSLMPTILGESLFVTNARDRIALRSELGRQAIAEGYYEALAQYFALRSLGARYELVTPPPPSMMEAQVGFAQVGVTNTSPSFWPAGTVALTVGAVPAVRLYDGSSQLGAVLGSIPLPVDLGPGQSVVVDVPFVAPEYRLFASRAGATFLKFDLVSGGRRFALRGVAPLQVPLVVIPDPALMPLPTPTPTPLPTIDPALIAPPTPTPTPVDPGTLPTPTPVDPGALPTPSPSPILP